MKVSEVIEFLGSSPIKLEKRVQGFKGLFLKDIISTFNILSISAMPFLVYLIHP